MVIIFKWISMRTVTTFFLFVLSITLNAAAVSVEEAVEMALKSHPDAQSASLRHESAKADSRAIEASLRPRIDLNADYFPTKTFVMPANGIFSTRQSDAFHADISGSYPLWDFGRNSDRRQAASSKEDEASAGEALVQNSLIEQVWLRYYTVAYLEQLIETATKSAQFYQAQYERAVGMRKAGMKTAADESRFYASWMESDEHLKAARAEHGKALLSLGLLIGSDESVAIERRSLDRRIETLSFTQESGQLRKELSARNPQLQKLRMTIDHAKSLSDAAEKEAYGSVMLVGSYGMDNSLSYYDSSQVGIRGTIPLYDGGKLSAEAQKNRIAHTLSQKEYAAAEQALWQELYDAYSDFKRSDETIAAKAGVIDATVMALNLMEGRYAQGLATYVEVLESQSMLESARIAHAEAKFQKIRAWANMQKLLNKGCDNDACKN